MAKETEAEKKKDKPKTPAELKTERVALDSPLTNYIRAAYPIIWIQTNEESRAEREIIEVTKYLNRRLQVWSHSAGFSSFDGEADDEQDDPIAALQTAYSCENGMITIMRDLHDFLDIPKVKRILRDIARDFKQGKKTLIIISPLSQIPPELERDITMIEFKLPGSEMVATIFDGIYEQNKKALEKDGFKIDADERERVIQAAMGLTTNEVENAISKAMVDRAKMNGDEGRPPISKMVMTEKAQAVKKTGILEYFPVSESSKDIGGLENLKFWLDVRKNAFSLKAREFGLPCPRGILLVGLPGCGKSLSSKATANILGIPLIRFDIGRVFAGLVGQSEQNMRNAIQTIEAIGNCVVWVDEMEKAFAGAGGSGNSDSGVTQRIFGNFITWMQEKKTPSFIVATVNRIESLPPELLRKGRFDEIFMVGLPGPGEREEIFKIHISKRGRDVSKFNMDKLVKASQNFSGAEIEESVISGLYTAFYRSEKSGKPDDLKTEYITKALKDTTPLAVSAKSSLETMLKWAKNNAVNASNLDVLEQTSGRQLEI